MNPITSCVLRRWVWISQLFVLVALSPVLWAQETASSEPATSSSPAEAEVTFEKVWSDTRELLSAQALGISYGEMLASFSIILFALFIRKFVTHWFFEQLRRITRRTSVTWDDQVIDCLQTPVSYFVVILGFFIAFLQLPLDPVFNGYAIKTFQAVVIALVFWAIVRLMNVLTEVLGDVARRKGHSIGTFMPLINRAFRAFLVMLGVALVVQNFGIQIGPVLGALGIGGAAFAFAAKDTIANVYGSFALALDRPFKVGDWIQVGNTVDGDVEEIGLRSTKVRTWPKTVMSIPNHVLANEIINNWSRMPKRRVKQVVGVTYESSPEDMEGIVEDIRQLLREDEGVEQQFILVNFTDFGASSLDILVYYFTKSIAWLEHMDVRQRINVKIMRAIKKRGLSVAFPTRTLYLEGDTARQLAGQFNSAASHPPLPGDQGMSSPP